MKPFSRLRLRPSLPTRILAAAALGAAVLALPACSTLNSVASEVSSYGEWPAARQPGLYAFDRLPSQQALADETQKLEDAARPALAKAGFAEAGAGQTPDVLVQVGAHAGPSERAMWDDPVWWRGGFGYWNRGLWAGPYWGMGMSWRSAPTRYDREVAILLRDRETGKPLFEARAESEGAYGLDPGLLRAMFAAALMDFPRLGVNPRRVVVNPSQP